jgi:hypothetical protein
VEVEDVDKIKVSAPFFFLWEESGKLRKILKVFQPNKQKGYPLYKVMCLVVSLQLKCRLGVFNVQNMKRIYGPRTEEITDAGENFVMGILIFVSFTKY